MWKKRWTNEQHRFGLQHFRKYSHDFYLIHAPKVTKILYEVFSFRLFLKLMISKLFKNFPNTCIFNLIFLIQGMIFKLWFVSKRNLHFQYCVRNMSIMFRIRFNYFIHTTTFTNNDVRLWKYVFITGHQSESSVRWCSLWTVHI